MALFCFMQAPFCYAAVAKSTVMWQQCPVPLSSFFFAIVVRLIFQFELKTLSCT
jgi:hypothetical protein